MLKIILKLLLSKYLTYSYLLIFSLYSGLSQAFQFSSTAGYHGNFATCQVCHNGGGFAQATLTAPSTVLHNNISSNISVSAGFSGQRYGFNLAIYDQFNSKSFSGFNNSGGSINQSEGEVFNSNSFANNWNFSWITPGQLGVYTIYTCVLEANNDGSASGDATACEIQNIEVINNPPNAIDDPNALTIGEDDNTDSLIFVLSNDLATEGDGFSWVSDSISGSGNGFLDFNSFGAIYTFNPNNEFHYLNESETAFIYIDYVISEDSYPTYTDTARATITIVGENDMPGNVVKPAISGTALVGNTLTTSDGDWVDQDANDILTFSYQWRADGIDISGATTNNYTLTINERYKTITVLVGATDLAGSFRSTISPPVVVENNPPENNVLPAIAGTAFVGNLLTASEGNWSDVEGDPLSYFYQWKANNVAIADGTTDSYLLSAIEAHQSITVSVTADDGNGGTVTVNSTPVNVSNSLLVNTVPPAISGVLLVGNTINTTAGTWTDLDADSPSFSYQWKSDDVDINGAISSSYTLTNNESGVQISVEVTANDGNGSQLSVTSASITVGAVNNLPANTVPPVISGSALVGSEVTATTGTWTDADGDILTYSYQWASEGNSISGASASSYILTINEAHASVTVTVTANDANGGNIAVSSDDLNIDNTAPMNTVTPEISGTAEVGSIVSASDGSWSDVDGDIPTYSYQWRLNGNVIAGATLVDYTVSTSDAHGSLTVTVIANDGNSGLTLADSNAVVVANTAPVNTDLPVIGGSAFVGNTLNATNGSWLDADLDNLTFDYQWMADGNVIVGATQMNYTLTNDEIGMEITVEVTAKDSNEGGATAVSTGITEGTTNTAPLNLTLPIITGGALVGNSLDATTGTWDDEDDDVLNFTFQWQASGLDIPGATSNSFTLSENDAHKTIVITVVANDGKGGNVAISSAGTPVENSLPLNASLPIISGDVVVGGQLDVTDGIWSDLDMDVLNFTYQWHADDVAIPGATSSSNTLTSDESGALISVEVTANDGNGGIVLSTSAGTSIGNSEPVNIGLPLVSGLAQVGNTLNTTNGIWTDADDDNLSYSYQWLADGAEIVTATENSLILTSDQAHLNVSVKVVASDDVGGLANASSVSIALANTAPENTVLPVISGIVQSGNIVISTTGDWVDSDADDLIFSYQWRADSLIISGATDSSFTLTSDEDGQMISVVVLAFDNQGGATAATSDEVGATVDPDAPAVEIVKPSRNDFVNSLISISGIASDDTAIVSVEIEVTGASGIAMRIGQAGPILDDAFGPQRIPAIYSDGVWALNTSLLNWPADEYTITAYASDAASNTTTVTRSFTFFQGSPAFTTLSLETSAPSILNGESIEVSGKLTRLPDDSAIDLSSLPIELTLSDPNGIETVFNTFTTSRFGHFGFLQNSGNSISGFNEKGVYSITAEFPGNAALSPQTSDQVTVLVGTSPGYALIVQGKIDNEEGLESHNKTTNRIYDTLIKRGFVDTNIIYLNYDVGQTGVDGFPSKAGVRNAIENELAVLSSGVAAPVFLFMIDHGSPGEFHIGTESISAMELDDWMTTMEGNLSDDMKQENRFLIYGACYSGSFIPEVSKPGRIIIASSAGDEESYKGALEDDDIRVGEYFIEEFMKQLERGNSFEGGFNVATKITEIYTRRSDSESNQNRYFDFAAQHPLLDDNGDGVGSNFLDDDSLDGALSETLHLGVGISSITNSSLNPADFVATTDTSFLEAGTNSITLFARALDDGDIGSAWVEVRRPQISLVAGNGTIQLEVDLEKVLMSLNPGLERWEGTYGDISDSGIYEVFYFAKDNVTGLISPTKRSLIYRNKVGNLAPSIVQLISPENGSNEKTILSFNWTDAIDPDGDNVSYTLEIATDLNFASGSIVHKEEQIPSSIAMIASTDKLPDISVLYWRVTAIDQYGARSVSEISNFNTDNTNGIPGVIQGLIFSNRDFGRLNGVNVSSSIDESKIAITEFNGQYILLTEAGTNSTLVISSTDGSFPVKLVQGINVTSGGSTEVNVGIPVDTDNANSSSSSGGSNGGSGSSSGGKGGGSISIPILLMMLFLILILFRRQSGASLVGK